MNLDKVNKTKCVTVSFNAIAIQNCLSNILIFTVFYSFCVEILRAYSSGSNKGFSLRLYVISWVQHEILKKAEGYLSQNVESITIKMRSIVQIF